MAQRYNKLHKQLFFTWMEIRTLVSLFLSAFFQEIENFKHMNMFINLTVLSQSSIINIYNEAKGAS